MHVLAAEDLSGRMPAMGYYSASDSGGVSPGSISGNSPFTRLAYLEARAGVLKSTDALRWDERNPFRRKAFECGDGRRLLRGIRTGPRDGPTSRIVSRISASVTASAVPALSANRAQDQIIGKTRCGTRRPGRDGSADLCRDRSYSCRQGMLRRSGGATCGLY